MKILSTAIYLSMNNLFAGENIILSKFSINRSIVLFFAWCKFRNISIPIRWMHKIRRVYSVASTNIFEKMLCRKTHLLWKKVVTNFRQRSCFWIVTRWASLHKTLYPPKVCVVHSTELTLLNCCEFQTSCILTFGLGVAPTLSFVDLSADCIRYTVI